MQTKRKYEKAKISALELDPRQTILSVCNATDAIWIESPSYCVGMSTTSGGADNYCTAGAKGTAIWGKTADTQTPHSAGS